MKSGFYRGIAMSVLDRRHTHLGRPYRSVLNHVECRHNDSASTPLKTDPPLIALGFEEKLSQIDSVGGGEAAYRRAIVEGKPLDRSKPFGLFFPDNPRIAQ